MHTNNYLVECRVGRLHEQVFDTVSHSFSGQIFRLEVYEQLKPVNATSAVVGIVSREVRRAR